MIIKTTTGNAAFSFYAAMKDFEVEKHKIN